MVLETEFEFGRVATFDLEAKPGWALGSESQRTFSRRCNLDAFTVLFLCYHSVNCYYCVITVLLLWHYCAWYYCVVV